VAIAFMRRGLLYSFTYPPMKSKEACTKKKSRENKHDLRKCIIIFNETHQIIFKIKPETTSIRIIEKTKD